MMLFDTLRELDRMSSTVLSGFDSAALRSAPMNIYRDGDRYVAEADLPGFDPSSIDVSVEAGLLTIRAERSTESQKDDARWVIHERGSVSVVRQVALGDHVDLDAVSADYRDGVLTVTLPTRADARPRRIPVEEGKSAQRAIASSNATSESHGGLARALGELVHSWRKGTHERHDDRSSGNVPVRAGGRRTERVAA